MAKKKSERWKSPEPEQWGVVRVIDRGKVLGEIAVIPDTGDIYVDPRKSGVQYLKDGDTLPERSIYSKVVIHDPEAFFKGRYWPPELGTERHPLTLGEVLRCVQSYYQFPDFSVSREKLGRVMLELWRNGKETIEYRDLQKLLGMR